MSKRDTSFDADPNSKGSYWRAAEDIRVALQKLGADKLPAPAAFLFYYFGCEKLAKLVAGIATEKPRSRVVSSKAWFKTPKPDQLVRYLEKIRCHVPPADIHEIFDRENNLSARMLRERFVHQLGPSHAIEITQNAPRLVPKMKNFIASVDQLTGYIKDRALAVPN